MQIILEHPQRLLPALYEARKTTSAIQAVLLKVDPLRRITEASLCTLSHTNFRLNIEA